LAICREAASNFFYAASVISRELAEMRKSLSWLIKVFFRDKLFDKTENLNSKNPVYNRVPGFFVESRAYKFFQLPESMMV
jgi:hypothetical protein